MARGEHRILLRDPTTSLVNAPSLFFSLPYLVEFPLLGYNSSLTTLRVNPGESPTELQPSTRQAANEGPPYVLNSLGKESTFGIDGFYYGYPVNVAPTEESLPPHLIADNNNLGSPLPSLHAASIDVAFFKSPAELYASSPVPQPPLDRMCVSPANQHIPRNAVRRASNMRRTRPASYRCFFCGADYTKAHNLNCLSLFTDVFPD
jgi:hypothetical protein